MFDNLWAEDYALLSMFYNCLNSDHGITDVSYESMINFVNIFYKNSTDDIPWQFKTLFNHTNGCDGWVWISSIDDEDSAPELMEDFFIQVKRIGRID